MDDLEARSTLPGAACSMSQEPYDLTQQVSQPTAVPKKLFNQVRNDEGAEEAAIVMSCGKIVRRSFHMTSRCTHPPLPHRFSPGSKLFFGTVVGWLTCWVRSYDSCDMEHAAPGSVLRASK